MGKLLHRALYLVERIAKRGFEIAGYAFGFDRVTVHADFQLYDDETPEVGKTINVMCDNLVIRARVARIISHPLVDQVVADEF